MEVHSVYPNAPTGDHVVLGILRDQVLRKTGLDSATSCRRFLLANFKP